MISAKPQPQKPACQLITRVYRLLVAPQITLDAKTSIRRAAAGMIAKVQNPTIHHTGKPNDLPGPYG